MELLIKFLLGVCLFTIAESGLTRSTRCNTDCSDEYKPVCGQDRRYEPRTFKNLCLYELEKCRSLYSRWNLINENGECVYEKVTDPDPECQEDYRNCNIHIQNPICGRNEKGEYKEFKNICLFKRNQCDKEHTDNWEIFKKGSCPNGLTTQAPPRKHHCPNNCSEEFEPICGLLPDTNEIRVFNNKCFYDQILCENSNWKIMDDQECKQFMSNGDQPICGASNGKQKNFKNYATFLLKQTVDPNGNWKVVNNGKCARSSSPNCFSKCTKLFRPICTIDNEGNLKQFPNMCSYIYNNCIDPSKGLTMYRKGTCPNERSKRRVFLHDERLPLSCFGVCSFQYAPFCAISSAGQLRTFVNECEHDFEVCNNRDCVWKKMHDGPCSELFESSNNI